MLKFSLQQKQKESAKALIKLIDLNVIMEHVNELSFSMIKFSIPFSYKGFINSSALDSSGNRLLHIICQYNLPKLGNKLMNHRHMMSLTNDTGNTPIHIACRGNRFEIVDILMAHNADLTVRNSDGDTPLHTASKFAAFQCIKRIGTQECNTQNNSGNTPLHISCLIGSYACVTALSESSVCIQNNLGDSPLHIACRQGSFSIVYYLLKHFTDVQQALSSVNHKAELPLHIALMEFGKKTLTIIRLRAFFDVVKLTPNVVEHPSLMHLACQFRISPINCQIAHCFKSKGVGFEVPDNTGRLPIHYASSKTLKLVKICSSDILVNVQDSDGNTALHIACSSSKYNICRYLNCSRNAV